MYGIIQSSILAFESIAHSNFQEYEDLYSIVLPPNSKLALAIKSVQTTTGKPFLSEVKGVL